MFPGAPSRELVAPLANMLAAAVEGKGAKGNERPRKNHDPAPGAPRGGLHPSVEPRPGAGEHGVHGSPVRAGPGGGAPWMGSFEDPDHRLRPGSLRTQRFASTSFSSTLLRLAASRAV